jgi:5-formyltetrahydrofolate cyclo-ligase
MTKAELRANYLTKRKSISPQERSVKSSAISDLFFRSFDLARIRYLHVFLPIERLNEVNTRLIVEKIWDEYPHIQTVVPRVNSETDEIENLKFSANTELIENAWGIAEPGHSELVDSQDIDLVLVPGLCFDRTGHRVGYGKGFYDRLLATCRPDCLKIGVSYFDLVDKIGNVYEGDVRLDFVITPDGIHNSPLPA